MPTHDDSARQPTIVGQVKHVHKELHEGVHRLYDCFAERTIEVAEVCVCQLSL